MSKYSDQITRSKQLVNHSMTSASSGKYELNKTGFSTIDYPGLTILGMPIPVRNEPTSKYLCQCQNKLQQLPIFATVPTESFHITIADLAHGNVFTNLSTQNSIDIADAVKEVFNSHNNMPQFKGKLLGLGHFGTVMAGIVIPDNQEYFDHLNKLRNDLYDHHHLQAYKPTLPFVLHITLGYFCAPVDGSLSDYDEDITILHKQCNNDLDFIQDKSVTLNGAGLFSFENMDNYNNSAFSSFNLICNEI